MAIQTADILKTIQLFHDILAVFPGFRIFQRDTSKCCHFFLHHLVPITVIPQKNPVAIGRSIDPLKMGDVYVIVGQQDITAHRP